MENGKNWPKSGPKTPIICVFAKVFDFEKKNTKKSSPLGKMIKKSQKLAFW